jgi:hypothetical protein
MMINTQLLFVWNEKMNEKITSFSFFTNRFTWHNILGLISLSFQAFEYGITLSLTSKISAEKFINIYWFPLHVTIHFALAAFQHTIWLYLWQFLYDMCLWESAWILFIRCPFVYTFPRFWGLLILSL